MNFEASMMSLTIPEMVKGISPLSSSAMGYVCLFLYGLMKCKRNLAEVFSISSSVIGIMTTGGCFRTSLTLMSKGRRLGASVGGE